jgi:ribosomal protein L37E
VTPYTLEGPPGRQCTGDGTCSAALLNKAKHECHRCGCTTYDHETGRDHEPFCNNCGHPVSKRVLKRKCGVAP